MVKAFLHVNGVDYELATTLEEQQVQQLVERIATTTDGLQREPVVLGDARPVLVIDCSTVWAITGWVA